MDRFKYAGQTLKVKCKNSKLNNSDFIAEDYWINIPPKVSWKDSNGNPAAMIYAVRIAGTNIPLNDNVIYGKIDGLGYLFHESELVLPE